MFLKRSNDIMKLNFCTPSSGLRSLTWLTLTLVFVLSACTTTKKKDDLSGLGMLYQNMTAHYNGYFNATEIMKESESALQLEHKDNYNQILPVFEYTAVGDPKSVSGNLDEAIKKASVVISLHRPSKWTDDCYLLIGQAQYMKQDYESAQKTLEYMINNFDETGKSSEKVSSKKPSKAKARAERQKQILAKHKEIEERRKEQAKDRKERNKEIEENKKSQAKTRKEEKRERDKANKERLKKRKKYNAQRKKNKKKNSKNRKKVPFSTGSSTKEEPKKVEPKTEDKKSPIPVSPKKNDTKVESKRDLNKDEKEKEEEPKKRTEKQKAKDEKIKDGALAHAPAYPYGVLWLAKTYVERDFVTQADRLFKQIMNINSGDMDLMRELYPSVAHFYIYNENYSEAIPALEKAIEVSNNKPLKARYAYIIGQLKMLTGSKGEAVAYFDQAASWSRDYEMEFNAKMSSKLAAMSSGSRSKDDIAKELEKMGKDDKNAEYLDQIYFQIAKVYLEANDIPKAEEYLKLALEKANSNPAQKTEIHYALGDIYFSKDKFDKAFDNYSLALSSMPKTDSRYRLLENRTNSLTEIAINLKTLQLQDSLLMLAGLSDEELKERATAILKKKSEEMAIAEAKMAETAAKNVPSRLASTIPIATTSKIETKFFAYNEKDLKKGIREFDKRWNNRPLIDDWRRNEIGEESEQEEEDDAEFTFTKEPTTKEVEDIFKGLPKSDDEKIAANQKMADALYSLGMEYRNKLERLDLSSAAFERFTEVGAADARLPEAYYFLYLNARDQKDMATANHYAKILQEKFAETKFALLAADPSYIDELLSKKNTVSAMYEATYAAFEAADYKRVHGAFDQAKSKFGTDNEYISKFALLQAMSIGKLQGKEEYIQALRTVVAQYPNTTEQIRAREIIRFLGGDEDAFEKDHSAQFTITNFKFKEDELHYVIVALYNEDVVDVNDVKLSINDYNTLFHKLDKLSVRSFIINRDKKSNAILIRKFADKNAAMKYYEEVNGRKAEFLPEKTDAEVFAVGQTNYREMIKSGSAKSYLSYFKENYLR